MLTVNMAVFGCGELCSIILALHCFIFYMQYPRYKSKQRYLQTETDFISLDGKWSVFILLKDSSLGQLLHLFLITISFRQTADCFQLNFSYSQFNFKCWFSRVVGKSGFIEKFMNRTNTYLFTFTFMGM